MQRQNKSQSADKQSANTPRDIEPTGVADRLNAERPTEPGAFTPYAEPMAAIIQTNPEADEINTLHLRILARIRDVRADAIVIGAKLAAIKARLGHGAWEPWIAANLKFSSRTAVRYLYVWKHRDDPELQDNPEEFMDRVYGHTSDPALTLPKVAHALEVVVPNKSDVPPKSDASVGFLPAPSKSEVQYPNVSPPTVSEPESEEEPEAKSRRLSRPARWAKACADASAAIEELVDLQSEYQEWLDGIPENFSESAVIEKLNAVIDLSFDDALTAIEEAENADLPQGFGRD
jgi:hypothetical protein